MSELSYKSEAASAYDRAVAHVSTHFLPLLLRAARLEPGQRVLDAATGTGLAAEAALAIVGPGGHVTAADVSRAMVDRARQLLGCVPGCGGIASAKAADPRAAYPMNDTWMDCPVGEGLALVGDAAGYSDPHFGQGLR